MVWRIYNSLDAQTDESVYKIELFLVEVICKQCLAKSSANAD